MIGYERVSSQKTQAWSKWEWHRIDFEYRGFCIYCTFALAESE
jgi:hypothetical protein